MGDSPAVAGGASAPRSVGILGGTFNPPHLGHLALARHALQEASLDVVWLMPVHTPPHKHPEPGLADARERLAMCTLAVEGTPRLHASDLEVARTGPSYTADTLELIHDESPEIRLTLILGADMALTLPEWRRPRRIVELAELAVAERGGVGRERVMEALGALHVEPGRVRFLAMPEVPISSSLIRDRIGCGLPVDELLPGSVAGYIAERRLYTEAAA